MRGLGILLLAVLVVGGCTFRSTQMEGLLSLFESSGESVPHVWQATLGGKERSLAVTLDGDLFVFVSPVGDAVSFDGWLIRSVVGFGFSEPVAVRDADNMRSFRELGQYAYHRCEPWALQTLSAGSRWTQRCVGRTIYENSIELDSRGEIVTIDQVVTAGGDRVTLRRTGSA